MGRAQLRTSSPEPRLCLAPAGESGAGTPADPGQGFLRSRRCSSSFLVQERREALVPAATQARHFFLRPCPRRGIAACRHGLRALLRRAGHGRGGGTELGRGLRQQGRELSPDRSLPPPARLPGSAAVTRPRSGHLPAGLAPFRASTGRERGCPGPVSPPQLPPDPVKGCFLL